MMMPCGTICIPIRFGALPENHKGIAGLPVVDLVPFPELTGNSSMIFAVIKGWTIVEIVERVEFISLAKSARY